MARSVVATGSAFQAMDELALVRAGGGGEEGRREGKGGEGGGKEREMVRVERKDGGE